MGGLAATAGGIFGLTYEASPDWWRTSYQVELTGDGVRPITVTAADRAGHTASRLTSVILDNTPPEGSVLIEAGAPYATQVTVTLALAATDAYTVADMRLANEASGRLPLAAWESYVPSRTWALEAGDGERTAWVNYRDYAGNVSVYSDTVVLDTTPPEVWLSAPGRTYTPTVTVTWGGSDATSGVAGYDVDVRVDSGPYTRWQTQVTQTQAVYAGEHGHAYTFRVTATDRAGLAATTEKMTSVISVRKYYAAGGRRVAMRENGVVYYLHGDHLGSTSLVTCGSAGGCNGKPYQDVVSRQWYDPYGSLRGQVGTSPTDVGFTGQREDSYIKLIQMGARWYDADLGRWISPDSIVPQPGNPQALNRFAYCLNNPMRYTDPTGHWTDDQLAQALGKDWREKYFGKGSVFENRDKLLEFLISEKTTSPIVLGLVAGFLQPSQLAHSAGVSFDNIDALGARIAGSAGSVGFVGLTGDAVLNLSSGEFSVFISPEGGFILGESATVMGGITLLKNLPSNDAYRGTFEAVGLVGGDVVGLNAEGFWGAPLSDRFNAFENPHGGFIGSGPAVPGLGGYGSVSYSWEVYREDVQGSHAVPHRPNPFYAVIEVALAVKHDVLLHPLLPWSPYRR